MKLEHSFDVPVPVDEAWPVLLDVQRISPCMPGATIDEVNGDTFLGRVRVKAGPITVNYRGSARFAEVDNDEHRIVLEASGKEARGSGSVKATITARLRSADTTTVVDVTTDLSITGKPAQFGRGVMEDIGSTLIGQFAQSLAVELERAPAPALPNAAVTQNGSHSAPTSAPRSNESEPAAVNLLSVVGPVLVKRFGVAVVGVAVIVALLIRVRRSPRSP